MLRERRIQSSNQQSFRSIGAKASTFQLLPLHFKGRLMGSREKGGCWSVFDGVKSFPATPETLMAEINTATANLEYARSTALLESSTTSTTRNKKQDSGVTSQYDVRLADEAYRAGCAALAAGKLDEALQSLNTSLSKCPPDKTSAVAKLQSLINLTSQQLHKSPI